MMKSNNTLDGILNDARVGSLAKELSQKIAILKSKDKNILSIEYKCETIPNVGPEESDIFVSVDVFVKDDFKNMTAFKTYLASNGLPTDAMVETHKSYGFRANSYSNNAVLAQFYKK